MTKSGMQTQILSKATETWQKFRNSQIQDGGRTPYWKSFFLAITRLHIVRLTPKLEWWGIIARTRRLNDENVKFRKSNMADAGHVENYYISIYQPQLVRISRTQICHRWRKQQQKSEIRKFKMADGRGIKNHFSAITQLHVVPLWWNLEWGGRITRIGSRSGDQIPNYENPK